MQTYRADAEAAASLFDSCTSSSSPCTLLDPTPGELDSGLLDWKNTTIEKTLSKKHYTLLRKKITIVKKQYPFSNVEILALIISHNWSSSCLQLLTLPMQEDQLHV